MISFLREFLGREPGKLQREAYLAVWGNDPAIWDKKFHEIVLLVGMKGGKNYWAEGDIAYATYRISCLENPHEYFGKITGSLIPYPPEKTFDLVNVSVVNELQAKHAFFESVKNVLKLTKDPKTGENWFERYAGLDLREQFGDLKKKEIIFPTKKSGGGSIRLLSFNSSKTAPEGIHMLRGYADELSRAETKTTYAQAEGLLELLLGNTKASFPGNVGKTIEWAYPNETDFDLTNYRFELSQELDESGSLKNPDLYGMKATTWDFNPARTEAMFEKEFRTNPLRANCRFGCVKPISKDNFYQPYSFKLKEAIEPSLKNKIHYKQTKVYRKLENGQTKTVSSIEMINIVGDKRERCLAYDAGKTKDRFIVGVGYGETIDVKRMELFLDAETEVILTNKKPVIDVLVVIEPSPGCPVDYLKIGDILSIFLKAFPNIKTANSDHFQNEKLRQELEAKGKSANTYNFSNKQQVMLYEKVRWNVWNNNISICDDTEETHKLQILMKKISPSGLWVSEGERLLNLGNKIDHPVSSSKDVQDVVAILNHDIMALETQGVAGMADGIDGLSEAKLRELAEQFMNIKSDLLREEVSPDKMLKMIAEKMNLDLRRTVKLSEYVREIYDY